MKIAEKNFDEFKRSEAKSIDNDFDEVTLHALEVAKKNKLSKVKAKLKK